MGSFKRSEVLFHLFGSFTVMVRGEVVPLKMRGEQRLFNSYLKILIIVISTKIIHLFQISLYFLQIQ